MRTSRSARYVKVYITKARYGMRPFIVTTWFGEAHSGSPYRAGAPTNWSGGPLVA